MVVSEESSGVLFGAGFGGVVWKALTCLSVTFRVLCFPDGFSDNNLYSFFSGGFC